VTPVRIKRVAIIDFDVHHGNGTQVGRRQSHPAPSSNE
jgi:acetoin utilization deacetylase AcuC-like enzyme